MGHSMQMLVALFFILKILSAVSNQEVKNDNSQTPFTVFNRRWLNIPNMHRTGSPSLQISFTGAQVESVEKRSPSLWSLQMNTKSTLELSVQEKPNRNIREFTLEWKDDGPTEHRQLCIHYGFNGAKWYSTYQSIEPQWPMDTARKVEKSAFNFFVGHGLHSEEYYDILEHFFVNSDGFGMLLDPIQPWFIYRNPETELDDPIMCFSVDRKPPYYAKVGKNRNIKMHFFVAANIRLVTDYVVHESGHLPKPVEIPDKTKFSKPTWWALSTWGADHLNQDQLLKDAALMNQKGFTGIDFMLMQSIWQPKQDLTLDTVRFPNIASLVNELAKFNSVDNSAAPMQQYFVRDLSGKLTNILDFTIPDTRDVYLTLLNEFKFRYNVTHFNLDNNNIQNVVLFNETDPFLLEKTYLQTAAQKFSCTSLSAFKSQHLPLFLIQFSSGKSDQAKTLHEIIPNALSISTAGYSFFAPYLIGKELNGEEAYIRAVQATCLMPSMAFLYFPMFVNYSEKATELTKKFIQLHNEHVPLIIRLAEQRIELGTPIIRPMWYHEPDNPRTYTIADQFMVGEALLVAPVVAVGQRERSVYLPTGTWTDQTGKTYKGPGDFKVQAPIEELPYFKRATQ